MNDDRNRGRDVFLIGAIDSDGTLGSNIYATDMYNNKFFFDYRLRLQRVGAVVRYTMHRGHYNMQFSPGIGLPAAVSEKRATLSRHEVAKP